MIILPLCCVVNGTPDGSLCICGYRICDGCLVIHYAQDSVIYSNRDCNFIADLHFYFSKEAGISCPVVDRRIPRMREDNVK